MRTGLLYLLLILISKPTLAQEIVLVKPLSKLITRALKAGVERVIITDPGRPTFYELADLCSKKHDVSLQEWFAVRPNHFTGEVLEIRARSETKKPGKKPG